MTCEYVPQDLSSIKKVTDIKTPNDLENEITKLCETLKDLSKYLYLYIK